MDSTNTSALTHANSGYSTYVVTHGVTDCCGHNMLQDTTRYNGLLKQNHNKLGEYNTFCHNTVLIGRWYSTTVLCWISSNKGLFLLTDNLPLRGSDWCIYSLQLQTTKLPPNHRQIINK